MAIQKKSASAAQTEALGERLAHQLNGCEVIALYGGLGVGKTAFVRGLARGLGIMEGVSSPTFALVNEYHGKVPDDFDALLKLPGVGRKSANLIMGDVFGKPAIVTDTHCIRLSN